MTDKLIIGVGKMKKFKYLPELVPHIDSAFAAFYETMLSDERMEIFFKDDEQIKGLILKQKEHFTMTLDMELDKIKHTYIKLGEYHFDLNIPYIDFIKGSEVLEEYFLLHTQHSEITKESFEETLEYFKMMRGYTAKGYLNRMLAEDKEDIDTFFEQAISLDQPYLPVHIVLKKITWLRNLIEALENEDVWEFDDTSSLIHEWLQDIENLPEDKKVFFENLEKRIIYNTQNLFYFLKKGEYLEMLPLYSSLLTIYKLALMMNNAVTIEYANKVIEDMRFDPMTGLFRKDFFQEVLSKDIALVNRHHEDFFSVIYIDIDDFKQVNDQYGHYSGDKVLEKLGEIIRNNIRASDMGFRIGGDEIALILKYASAKNAKMVAEKIKKKFSDFEFIFTNEVTFRVTLSMGVQQYSANSPATYEEFIQKIDQKLYTAKRQGKDRIIG